VLSSLFVKLFSETTTAQPPLDSPLPLGKEIPEGILGEANTHLFDRSKGLWRNSMDNS